VPVPASTVDLAYSNQVMEHLHVEDGLEQVRNIYNALVPGGAFVCVTQTASQARGTFRAGLMRRPRVCI